MLDKISQIFFIDGTEFALEVNPNSQRNDFQSFEIKEVKNKKPVLFGFFENGFLNQKSIKKTFYLKKQKYTLTFQKGLETTMLLVEKDKKLIFAEFLF